MSSGGFGTFFCCIGLVAAGISLGLPYWEYVEGSSKTVHSGLWQICTNDECEFLKFGILDWFDTVRVLEVIGCVLGLLAACQSACSGKTRNRYVSAGSTALLGAACVGAGFITYAVKVTDPFEYAHAGVYLNIAGCAGLGIGGLLLLCTQPDPVLQSGNVIHSYGYQQPGYHIGMQQRY